MCVCLRENLPICLLVVESEEITKFRILKEVIRKCGSENAANRYGSFELYSWLVHDWSQLVQVQNHKTFEPNMCSR